MMKWILILIFVFSGYQFAESRFLDGELNPEAPKIYLLRAPRSGSHWFFYCCNLLFKKSVYADSQVCPYKDDEYIYQGGGGLITAHNPYDLHLDENSHNEDLLILLVRNYRECLLRDYGHPEFVKDEILFQASFNHLSHNRDWVLKLRMNHFFHNFRVYELWNPEKRLVVYYEDLLQDPRKTLLQIANFIGETDKERDIQYFVENINEHIENSLNIYEKGYNSHTRGRSFLHHTYRVGLEKSLELDQLVIDYFPGYIDRYLARYLLESCK